MKLNLILIINLIVIAGCDLRTSQSYFDEAYDLEEEGKYEAAILLLDKAIEKNPNFLGAYINRGADKSALGRYAEAIKDYEKVVKIDPDNVLAIFNIANNLKRLEKYGEAVDFYNKAIELKSIGIFQIDWNKNSYVHYEEADYDIPSVHIEYERAMAYYEIDSLNQAFRGFSNCVNKNYMKKESLNEIGNLYYVSGQYDEACKYFEQSAMFGDEDGRFNFNKFCNKKEHGSQQSAKRQ